MRTEKIKLEIIHSMRYLQKNQMNLGSEGNISVRFNNGFFITPSAIIPPFLKKSNIVYKDFNKTFSSNQKPSSEWRMHQSIYKMKSDVNAIVHCHSMWSSILSCLRKKIPSFHYMVAEIGGKDIKCSRYATFGSEQISKNILQALEERKGCLISNHGQISIGNNLDEAMHLSFAIEKLSKQFYHCLISKNYKLLNSKQISDSLLLFKEYKGLKH
tara:strand:+ start:4642 stop:5283 length:642 start_codon:yes stop_codon:yes gene_type:complete